MAREQRQRYERGWQAAPRGPQARLPGTGPRVTPIRVAIGVALVGTLAYLAFALTVRDASQIPMLASGAAVLGIVFAVLAVSGVVATYRAGAEGASGRAFGLAILGGIAAIVAAGCFAGAVVLGLLATGP